MLNCSDVQARWKNKPSQRRHAKDTSFIVFFPVLRMCHKHTIVGIFITVHFVGKVIFCVNLRIGGNNSSLQNLNFICIATCRPLFKLSRWVRQGRLQEWNHLLGIGKDIFLEYILLCQQLGHSNKLLRGPQYSQREPGSSKRSALNWSLLWKKGIAVRDPCQQILLYALIPICLFLLNMSKSNYVIVLYYFMLMMSPPFHPIILN